MLNFIREIFVIIQEGKNKKVTSLVTLGRSLSTIYLTQESYQKWEYNILVLLTLIFV